MSVTNNHILATKVLLHDHWPEGDILPVIPGDGFTDSAHHNIAAPTGGFKVGQRARYYDKTAKGYSTLIYLQFTTPSDVAYGAGSIISEADATLNSSLYYWKTTNDPDEVKFFGGRGAICLSAMTTDYYGWAWCGGVCPQETRAAVSGLVASYIDAYWDIGVVTGACKATIGNQSLDELALITPANYDDLIFAELNAIAIDKAA